MKKGNRRILILTIPTPGYRLIKDFDQKLRSSGCERIATGTRKLFLPENLPKGSLSGSIGAVGVWEDIP